MQIIFIHHSCFLVEIDDKVLIFDYFAGDRVNGFSFKGQLPAYEPDTPVYVFASHKHQDHFDMDILKWAGYYTNIHYILSKDCKMTGRFLERHGVDANVKELITYVSANETYEIAGGVKVETLRSTDAGVAFYVDVNGATFFHAGDLNNWKWDGAGELTNGKMERDYKGQMKKLANKKINIAFIPADPRQGEYQFLGLDYVLQNTNAEYIFPMHMWQDYSGIGRYIAKLANKRMAERIVEITKENQEFEIREN